MTNSYRPLPMLLVCTTTIQGTLSVSILHNKLFPSSGTKAGLFRWAAIPPYINCVLILLHVLYFAKIDLFWKIGILLQFLGFVGVFRSSNGSYHSVVCVCVCDMAVVLSLICLSCPLWFAQGIEPGGYCHIWAVLVCAAVKGMVFKQFTLGQGI